MYQVSNQLVNRKTNFNWKIISLDLLRNRFFSNKRKKNHDITFKTLMVREFIAGLSGNTLNRL